ncbi:MAG: MATE family efflux transporter [Bacteroidota bacterium]
MKGTKLSTSYKEILAISTPIMLGSAAQNVITLTDGIFLGRVGEVELGAIGFVGVFYLIIAAIGYGFSKGGQIMIARRMGEGRIDEVGKATYSMIYMELFLATVLFCFMFFGADWFFSFFVNSEKIKLASLEYLDYRQYGIFFSYVGVAIIALYTGVARTAFIIYDTIVLGLVNIILNYGLIFGQFGLPEMGIAGAGLASTIAEIAAFAFFLVYIIFDKEARRYKLFSLPKVNIQTIKTQLTLGVPIVAQFVVGLGSWFIFFSIVENLGELELASANLVRMVYLCLSIPCWGFSSGINTLVSNFIGQGQPKLVMPVIQKTAKLCFFITAFFTALVLIFPDAVLAVGTHDQAIIDMAKTTLFVLAIILGLFSIGGIYFNGIVGTGATYFGLKLQVLCAVVYLVYIYTVIVLLNGGLRMAWTAEIFYWVLMLSLSIWYLRSLKWLRVKV